ncbi:hypothetical protein AX14_010272 [Amanita brunnescens Koide BX004]|nr:hypothetical protein AX14_010272 [Amanita brunnescens Koide BX004]
MQFIVADLTVVIVLALVMPLHSLQVAPVWASASLAIDITITGIMIWSLTKNEVLSKQLKSKVTRLVHLVMGTGALTAAINLVTVILASLGSRAVYGPAIVLSKLYANSMMVFLNDRIPSYHGRDGQIASEMVTGALGSIHFATAPGPADTAQEQLALDEGCNNASCTSV